MSKIITLAFLLLGLTMGAQKFGKASWYSYKDNGGSETASGIPFNENKLTCASVKDYKFRTKLRVTNVTNGKSVIVTVTDRGGMINHKTGRLVDLSKGAFEKIASLKSGVIRVKIEIIK